MTTLTRSPAWQALASHYGQIKHLHLRGLFADDPGRAARLSAEGAGLFLDYSKNRITDETLQLLLALGEERGVAWRGVAWRSGAMRCSPVTRSTSQSAVRFCT
jgi:glucose-6-phosphate isomerase